jgi:hypothetical protein
MSNASRKAPAEDSHASPSLGTDRASIEAPLAKTARPEWSLSRMSLGSTASDHGAGNGSRVPGSDAASAGSGLRTFPYQSQIERGLGTQIIGQAVVDPEGCRRRNVPAFAENKRAHFATAQPTIRIAAHEAVHLLQHAGITNEAGLGPERHANASAQAIAGGGSARPLIGPAGNPVQSAIRPYTEVPVASQTATEWDAKLPLRLSEDGRMAVGQDTAMHSFWADSSLIAQSNTILDGRKSVIRLTQLSDSISGTAPTGGAHTLSKVSAKNAGTSTEGDAMNIWADCGKSARDVMGAGEGTGKHFEKMTADFMAMEKPPKWLRYLGALPILLSGTPHIGKQQTVASGPEAMKKEIFNEKLGGTGDEGLKKYNAMSPDEKEKFDKETGINRYAAPEAGQGYTMSSGGAPVPGHSTWNFHWAGVIMNSGNDRVTLENYSVSNPAVQNSDWEFQMYGSAAKAGQTFYEQHKATGQHGDAPTAMQVEKR